MPFSLIDLVKAKIPYKFEDPLLDVIDFTKPYHGLLDFRRNRLITLAKYKETISCLSDLNNLQPIFNIQDLYTSGVDFVDILKENSDIPYHLVVYAGNPIVRWVSEKKLKIYEIKKTDSQTTWDQALTPDTVVGLRLKAAALDCIYNRLNWVRDKFNSDIVLNNYIYNHQYNQAIKYTQGQQDNLFLLELYADNMNMDLPTAAKHCIFCFEEDLYSIAKTEKIKKVYEQKIISSDCLLTLQHICAEWNRINIGQL